MEKKWIVKSIPSRVEAVSLKTKLGFEKLGIPYLLNQRGISEFDAARDFFKPDGSHLHNPWLMKGMGAAVDRLVAAIGKRERILILGDYDVDGTSAVSLLWNVLKPIYANLEIYIPDRYSEGYGLSMRAVDYAKEGSFALVICLDCGVSALDQIDYGQSMGIDFIVCDHHTPGPILPNCIVLNPKQQDCPYPFKELCGCGVGFKLMTAFLEACDYSDVTLWENVDLLALAIGADIVSVTDENRYFAQRGLELFNHQPRKIFQRIFQKLNIPLPITLTDLSFSIAPRINAAGRMASGMEAVNMMICEGEEDITRLVAIIEAHNKDRKTHDREIVQQCIDYLEAHPDELKQDALILHQADWHKGVVGIVAARMVDQYYKPTLVLTEMDGKLSGSARSIEGINMYEVLAECKDLLEVFGGHYYAAGLSLKKEHLEAFKDRFQAEVSRRLSPDQKIPKLQIDLEVKLDDFFETSENISSLPKFYRVLEKFEPFGPDNVKPLFLIKKAYAMNPRLLKDEHIKCSLSQEGSGVAIDAIGFFMRDKYDLLQQSKYVDAVVSLSSNTWNNSTTLQLQLIDIKATK